LSWIDHHFLVVGLAVFGLAYLNSRVTFPTPNDRIAGPCRPTSPLGRDRHPL